MFNKKFTLLFSALVASSAIAAPLRLSARACDTAALASDLATLSNTAQEILAINFPFADSIRASADNAATFDVVLSAIADATTAVAANDITSALASIDTISSNLGDASSGLFGQIDFQDGQGSELDNDLFSDLRDLKAVAAACA
ncbi:hypothetical protein C8R46DRAFT_1111931 [Mycena filopes]|nr:hypothetical protein C8R46DRAFT_1111931 [Mycena filopes]